jgi:hypothetical protein
LNFIIQIHLLLLLNHSGKCHIHGQFEKFMKSHAMLKK